MKWPPAKYSLQGYKQLLGASVTCTEFKKCCVHLSERDTDEGSLLSASGPPPSQREKGGGRTGGIS